MSENRAEVDFDHHSLSWLAERHVHNHELRQRCPVIWNKRYGGFWFVSGYDEVAAIARHSDTFSPLYQENPVDGLQFLGIMGIPRGGMPPVGIAESVGNRHAALRRVVNPFMLPPAVAKDRPFLDQAATWFLDQRIADGAMDMVSDFTNPVPAIWTMRILGLPAESWLHYAEYFHATAAYPQDSNEYQQAVARNPELIAEAIQLLDERRKSPGDDLLSELVTMEVDGETLGNEELVPILWNLIGGGLDTTTSLTSLALVHLEEHPDLRERLVEDPELILPACEEYLRSTSVNETLTRTCTEDTVLGGQQIKRGDFVMMSWLGANFDPKVFDEPDVVDIDRSPNPHLAFGVGTHRCIGLHVARTLFHVMVREVLTRIPDYKVEHQATQFYRGNPELYGVVTMPVTFTPGDPVGVKRPF
jgi:cytochrome P450